MFLPYYESVHVCAVQLIEHPLAVLQSLFVDVELVWGDTSVRVGSAAHCISEI